MFEIKKAETQNEKQISYHIRYKVFCNELGMGFKKKYIDELETDFYDDLNTTQHYIAFVNGKAIGTTRIINENRDVAKYKNTRFGLSIEEGYNLKNYEKDTKRAEFTRVAILPEYRNNTNLPKMWKKIVNDCNKNGIDNLISGVALETDCLDDALFAYKTIIKKNLFDYNYVVKRVAKVIPKKNPHYFIRKDGEIRISKILETCFRCGFRLIGKPSYYNNFEMLIVPLNWSTDLRYASPFLRRFFRN